MNILYLAHRIPYPPNKGDKLRAFRQIEHLAKRHRVWCACFVDEPDDRRFAAPLAEHCQDLVALPLNRGWASLHGLLGLVTGGSVTESYYRTATMESVLANWVKTVPFDAVLAFSSSMAPYALRVSAPRRILDLCDLDSQKWLDYARYSLPPLRWLLSLEGRRLAAAERRWLTAFDSVVLITEAERALLGQAGQVIHVVGNGVNLPIDNPNHEIAMEEQLVIGFVGVMNYRPNIDAVQWFVRECWPGVRARFPEAVFRIIGRAPTRAVRRLARVQGVEVTGEVASMAEQVQSLAVSVAPLRIARGLQNKVLEAMAAAKPVVLTSAAAAGLEVTDEVHVLVRDDAQGIGDAVCRLLANRHLRRRMGLEARKFVAMHHRWDIELDKLDGLLEGTPLPNDSRRTSTRGQLRIWSQITSRNS